MPRKISNENFVWENEYMARNNLSAIAGVDEVGRGPLAGPVVVASVIMPHDVYIEGIKDSKKLSEKRREELYDKIIAAALEYHIEMADHDIIDKCNILNATKQCMARAIDALNNADVRVLVDGNDIHLDTHHDIEYVIKGDAISYSIGAASILAKVTRDRMMSEYDKIYPSYDFANNKGYGTAKHIAAIRTEGPCPIHRRTFIKNFVKADNK